jgi:hypothetical protein
MTNQPNNWVEEDRPEVVEAIVSGMMLSFSQKDLRRMVWDMLYDDLIFQDWSELFMHAEQYAPALLDDFNEPSSKL